MDFEPTHHIALQKDGFITCPCCENRIEIKRMPKGGAAYAKKMKVVPYKGLAILEFVYNNFKFDYWTKKDMWPHFSGMMNRNTFNARISELVGLKLFTMDREGLADPLYSVDTYRAYGVLKRKGFIHSNNS